MVMHERGGFESAHGSPSSMAGLVLLTTGLLCLNVIPLLGLAFTDPTPFLFTGLLLVVVAAPLIYAGGSRLIRMHRDLGEIHDVGDVVNLTLQYIVGMEIIILLLAWMLSDFLASF